MKFRSPSASSRAFSLVEVTLALGIAAFCIIPLVALLPIGLSSNQAALQQSVAASIAQAVVSDLRAAPTPASTTASVVTPRYNFTIPALSVTSSSTATINVRDDTSLSSDNSTGPQAAAPAADAHYKVALTFVPPTTTSRAATMVRVLVVWPPQADPTSQQVPTKFTNSFETVFALDRN